LLKPPPIEKKDQVEIPIPNQMQMSHLPQTLEEKQLLVQFYSLRSIQSIHFKNK